MNQVRNSKLRVENNYKKIVDSDVMIVRNIKATNLKSKFYVLCLYSCSLV